MESPEQEITVVEVLKRTATLLRGGWCQVTSAETARGHAVSPNAVTAVRFCITGALYRAVRELADPEDVREETDPLSYQALRERCRLQLGLHEPELPPGSLVRWNDALERTQAEVITLVEEVIACLK